MRFTVRYKVKGEAGWLQKVVEAANSVQAKESFEKENGNKVEVISVKEGINK